MVLLFAKKGFLAVLFRGVIEDAFVVTITMAGNHELHVETVSAKQVLPSTSRRLGRLMFIAFNWLHYLCRWSLCLL